MPRIITADQTELYVKDWGEGPPVVLIHGWPLNADSWDDQAVALAEAGYRVISYDRRGFGRSSQPWTGYDYDTLADDLACVIERLDLQEVTLVGFSMGGGEVARYLSRHGSASVARAVLVSSVLPFRTRTADNPTGTEASVFDRMGRALHDDRAKFFTGFFRDFFGAGLLDNRVSDEVLRWAHGMAMQASLRATVACLRAFSSTDFRGDLAAFDVPTLIIHGTDDKTVPMSGSSRLSAAAMPTARLIPYEGAPHGVFVTHKQRLTRDLLAFLRSDVAVAPA
jgi:non-heme chloroperoxidase